MKLFTFLVCFITVPSAFGDNSPFQNEGEIDRARSSWNFGGHHPVRKSAYWNRPRNVAGPGAVIADRRMGSASFPIAMAPYRKKSQSPVQPQKRQNNKPYTPGKPFSKRNTNFPFGISPNPGFPEAYSPYFNSQQPRAPWHRSSRKLRPTVDTIKNRFMKEELWHLDKGESYVIKDEDLVKDSILRNQHHESNDLDYDHEEESQQEQLEKDAEYMVDQYNDDIDDAPKHVIHHHHHYEVAAKQPAKPEVHNVNAFSPRTPSLTRRRRRRSADLPQIQIPTSAQSQNLLQQLFGGSSSKLTPVVTRKHYASHVGNGKNPQNSYKVPATIIAPPHFDKDDVLAMLLGSGGVSAEKMGTVVATNNRYVRYGRGLPNTATQGTRQGRHLQWPSPKTHPQYMGNHIPHVVKMPQPVKKPVVQLTPYSNKSPVYPSQPAYIPQNISPQKTPPVIFNVQISPMTKQQPTGPVINVPIPQPNNNAEHHDAEHDHHDEHYHLFDEQEHSPPAVEQAPQEQAPETQDYNNNVQQRSNMETMSSLSTAVVEQQKEKPSVPFQTVVVTPSGKAKKLDTFKYTDWSPLDLTKPQPQKAYYYEYLNSEEPSESNFHYRKLKPNSVSKGKKELGRSVQYYDRINDQLPDGGTVSSAADSISDYYENVFPLKKEKFEYSKINKWADIYPAVGKVSYAVKNYKDELDSVLHAISVGEREAEGYDTVAEYPESNDVYDGVGSKSSFRAISKLVDNDDDNGAYSQSEKYYTVKKASSKIPEPIYINVPQDDDFSNEVKK